jgi:hypothetical protein
MAMLDVPEIDTPPCRWPHGDGQTLYIPFKWGDRLQTPGSLWRNAFEEALDAWSFTATHIWYYFNSSATNEVNTYDTPNGQGGVTEIVCYYNQTLQVTIKGNIYYDILNSYTVNQRRGIASHEVGHGVSVGHIPRSYSRGFAILYPDPSLSEFEVFNTPQPPDEGLINRIYP